MNLPVPKHSTIAHEELPDLPNGTQAMRVYNLTIYDANNRLKRKTPRDPFDVSEQDQATLEKRDDVFICTIKDQAGDQRCKLFLVYDPATKSATTVQEIGGNLYKIEMKAFDFHSLAAGIEILFYVRDGLVGEPATHDGSIHLGN